MSKYLSYFDFDLGLPLFLTQTKPRASSCKEHKSRSYELEILPRANAELRRREELNSFCRCQEPL